MPVHVEEASNGYFPDFSDPRRAIRVSRNYCLTFTGAELKTMEKLAQGYGPTRHDRGNVDSVGALVRDVLLDYLRPEPNAGIAPDALAHQDDELAGRLPI